MHANTLLAALFATAAVAAPLNAASVPEAVDLQDEGFVVRPADVANFAPQSASEPDWIIRSLKRTCDSGDKKCTWDYSIDTQKPGGKPYHCHYTVKSQGGAPASESKGGPVECGPFTITSGWSSQGFTTITPVHPPTKRIIYAGYADDLLKNGKTVKDAKWKVEQTP